MYMKFIDTIRYSTMFYGLIYHNSLVLNQKVVVSATLIMHNYVGTITLW